MLEELYKCIEEIFHFQQTQQALLQYQNGKLVEDSLSGSITLLDACGSTRAGLDLRAGGRGGSLGLNFFMGIKFIIFT